jgi:hypothetical protein
MPDIGICKDTEHLAPRTIKLFSHPNSTFEFNVEKDNPSQLTDNDIALDKYY